MRFSAFRSGFYDVLAAVLPVGVLLAVLGAAEVLRAALPEPIGATTGTFVVICGALVFIWCSLPVAQQDGHDSPT